MRSGWRARRTDGGRRASPRGRARRRVDPQSLLGRQRRAARRILSRGRRAGACDVAARRGDVSRDSRRRRERLGFQLAMVRRFANAGVDRHDRNHSGRPQRVCCSGSRTRSAPVANGPAITIAPRITPARRRAPRGDRSLPLGSIPRRLSRLSLDAEAAQSTGVSAATLYPLFTHVASEAQAASVAQSRRGGIAEARRDRRDDARHRAAMGLRRTDGRRCSGSRSTG